MRRFLNDFTKENSHVYNDLSCVHKMEHNTLIRLNFAYTSWWRQFWRSEEQTPDSIKRLGWDENIRSMQEDEFDKIRVGSALIVVVQTEML